ncbi:DUF2523 domain-containing protein [Deefgea piscis]|uniref:DUF2523 domain-containing protein n=2 Tax=Deefgea TaxID=400947 RepID=A0A6M8SK67_9NEIS|nr:MULTISPECIES: DUF2523 family protein [Deefgea]QKJ65475.1 DUF2523 domain-containing protein [Deefgea piscis]QZA78487.1 DUF2523 domain-containing protein [Deefgea tanakiae]
MFGILLSAFNAVIGWVFRTLIVKFVVAFAVFYLVQLMAENLIDLLPGVDGLNSAFGGVAPTVWWYLDAFEIAAGIQMVIAAYVTRFLIRRIPVIG